MKALQCDKCSDKCSWKCIDCLGMSSGTYDVLINDSSTNLRWFCDQCEKSFSNPKMESESVENDQTLSKIDEILKIVEQVLDKANTADKRLDSIEKQLGDKADISVMKQLETRLKKIEEKLDTPNTSNHSRLLNEPSCALSESKKGCPKDPIVANMNEIQDRDRRKSNIFIFNVKECTGDNTDVRKEYDMAKVTELLSNEMNVMTTVTNPVRLGPKKENMQWPRPLCITVDSEGTKQNILIESKNLQASREETVKRIFMKKDMTPMEREQETSLKNQLSQKRMQSEESGDQTKWVIRKGRIVKVQ